MSTRGYRTRLIPVLLAVLVVGGLFFVTSQAASAADSGPTQTGEICMQKVFATPVTSANKINCTANDIRISRAISVSPDTCIAGTKIDLTATFETIVTANSRYDAGYFFRIDGGSNARGDGAGATGQCSLSALTPGTAPSLDLDGDTCGDLNSGTYELTFTLPQVECKDTNNDGFLNLPNCTSWHNKQGTVCSSGNAVDFHPDTKSKCVCDDTFQVPVQVESPSGAVTKKATKAVVTYEVQVKNNSSSVTVKINSLSDDKYGDIADPTNSEILTTTCDELIGDQLAPNGGTSDTCEFTVEWSDPGTDGNHTNKVTAELEDTNDDTNKTTVDGSTTINVQLNNTPEP